MLVLSLIILVLFIITIETLPYTKSYFNKLDILSRVCPLIILIFYQCIYASSSDKYFCCAIISMDMLSYFGITVALLILSFSSISY